MSTSLEYKHKISFIGNPDAKKTIVFAHGFGTDQTSWKVVTPAFEKNYRIILFDNVGGGSSDMAAFSPIKYSSLDAYADDLIAIAKAYHLKDAIIVAHSVGSMISAIAAIKAPEYFSRLVLVGASPRYINDGNYKGGFEQEQLDEMFDLMQTNYYAWVSGFSVAAMGNPDKPELGNRFAQTLGMIRPDIALSVAKVIFESDLRDRLPQLKKETLLIQTQADMAVPGEVAEYLHEHISGSKLVYIDAEGHFPHISNPDILVDAIKDFINRA